MRIAWFSPFPPVRTGVAACSAELVATLRERGCQIDAYPEEAAHAFPWRQRLRPYDLIVYQFGNSSHHDYAWPYALRYPGLVVLHDTRLHHARAALLLRERRRSQYRADFAWNEPDVGRDAAELAIAGFDSRLYYEWPMCRALVEGSRLVAVHGEATRRELIDVLSRSDDRGPMGDGAMGAGRWAMAEKIVAIRLGHGHPVSANQEAAARAAIRGRYRIPADAVLFGVFGGLTPEKRIPQILAAFRATLPYAPGARLLLAGTQAAHADFSQADFADVADRVTLTGYVADELLTDHIASVDVSLNLRWPTARETSGPWLRALAAAKPTIITDLLQATDVATLDPRTWQTRPSIVARQPMPAEQAVAIAVDILDEDHSLRLAMRRLATDADMRATLGRAAQEYWRREHSIAAMADDYERIIHAILQAAPVASPLPAHMRPDGSEQLRALLQPFGMDSPL